MASLTTIGDSSSPSPIHAIQSMGTESLTPITSTNDTEKSSSSLKIKSLTATTSEGKTPSSWDSKDDILLRHLKEIKKLGWKEIAQYFSNRTPNACQFRWRRLRSGSLKHKSIAQNMELENVKIQGELEAPTKQVSNSMATVAKTISSSSSSRRGSNSSNISAISQATNFLTKKKPRSRSIPASVSPNLRQQSSSKQHMSYAHVGQMYESYNQMTPPSHNYSMSSHGISNNNNLSSAATSRYRKNSLTATPPSNGSFNSSTSASVVYPIINDEQVGYIPKIKIRSRRNSTVSLSTRQQPSTNMSSSCFLDSSQNDFRNRSNSASNSIVSMERRLSILMGSSNLQFCPGSGGSNGNSANGSRRGSGMIHSNSSTLFNNNNGSYVGVHGSTGPPSAQSGLGKRDDDVAVEDD